MYGWNLNYFLTNGGSTRTRTEIALQSRAYTDYKSVMLPLHHGT